MSDLEDTKPYNNHELKQYELVFRKISAHFLTQELPKGKKNYSLGTKKSNQETINI